MDKVNWQEEYQTEGLTSGYTDLTTKQPMYKAVLSCNVAPWWTNPEMDTKKTGVTRS